MTEIHIKHDGPLDIAIGRNRKETSWKNKEWEWSDLVKKVSDTHRTAETHAEYLTAKKPRQDEIKDIGGFVGGYLSSGRRKSGNVVHRQLLTLDADFANSSFWDDFTMMYSNAAVIYSTHKHSAEHPRLRLIIPLDRPVMPDEYEAIARRIAGVLNIELFDPTTFQPERLMYWPSTSKDADYVFEYQDGPWLCADTVLATYHNWKDTSEWPVSVKVDAVRTKEMKKQGDPLEKHGVVGAFCRTYDIHEAIETFLSDVYEYCDGGRYTYKQGSTAAGLITYDDIFAYSHHGTDPTSGHLCNAFDLVRIHKFGLKDSDVKANTPANKYPSFIAMEDLAAKDVRVKKIRNAELVKGAKEDFQTDDAIEAEVVEDDTWTDELEIDRKGNFISSINNIYLFLKKDPKLKDRLYLNEFEGRLIVKKNLPWRKVSKATKDFTDDDADCLAHYLERNKMPFTHISKALAKIKTDNKIHPVKEYLSGLTWDGEQRLDGLFVDYLGAEDNDYTRSVARKTFVAAVARVFEPGVKFDTVCTLVGKEGIGKSTLIAKLAKEWFSDCLGDIHNKEGMESLRGVWIMEIAELASLKKADQDAIKRFISSREDVYRPAYGKQQVRYPRQCVFFATTNKEDFLQGSHGNRRFLPIDTLIQQPTKSVFKDLTAEEINQIWAEATYYYHKNESLDLEKEAKAAAEKIRESHSETDERTGMIERYLNMLLPDNWDEMSIYQRRGYISEDDELQAAGKNERSQVCIAEIWCEVLQGTQKDMTSQNTKYIHDIMRKMKGWMPAKNPKYFGSYGRQRGYLRINVDNAVHDNAKVSVVKKQ